VRKPISEALKQRALGKVEGQVCTEDVDSREDEGPSGNERRCEKEVICTDEGTLGCTEDG